MENNFNKVLGTFDVFLIQPERTSHETTFQPKMSGQHSRKSWKGNNIRAKLDVDVTPKQKWSGEYSRRSSWLCLRSSSS